MRRSASLANTTCRSSRRRATLDAHDADGIPLLDYHGNIGLQYNPIAIAQWGLGNFNLFLRSQR